MGTVSAATETKQVSRSRGRRNLILDGKLRDRLRARVKIPGGNFSPTDGRGSPSVTKDSTREYNVGLDLLAGWSGSHVGFVYFMEP